MSNTAIALNSSLNLEAVLDQVLANVKRVVTHDGATIMLIDGDVAQVVCVRGRCSADTIDRVRHSISTTDNLRKRRQL